MEQISRIEDYEEGREFILFKLSKEEFHSGVKPDLPEGGPWKPFNVKHVGNVVETSYYRELGKTVLLD